MISHVMVGTNDLERAKAFYAELLSVFGAQPAFVNERGAMFAGPSGPPMLGVTKPFDEKAATVGNGTMVSLRCESPAQVRTLYEKAMSLGATSEGEPGPRGDQGQFYGAYFRDLDGNKLAGFAMNAPEEAGGAGA